MSSPTIHTGPFVVGEKPAPLVYQFLDSNGVPIDLTGYTAMFEYTERDGTATSALATITTPASGLVQHIWTGAEMASSGHYISQFWVGNNSNRFASIRITYDVAVPVGAVPSI